MASAVIRSQLKYNVGWQEMARDYMLDTHVHILTAYQYTEMMLPSCWITHIFTDEFGKTNKKTERSQIALKALVAATILQC